MSKHTTESAVRRALSGLALAIGSLLPFIIAWVLIASTNDENPLDAIPDYSAPLQETLALTGHESTTVSTDYEYHNTVRVIIEGTLTTANGASSDAFFTFTDANGTPLDVPTLHDWAITVDGVDLTTALTLTELSYDRDHTYTGLYAVSTDWAQITFNTTLNAPDGDLRITVLQVE